jgi:hypothetical protein
VPGPTEIVAIAAVVEPVVAVCDRAQRRTWAVSLTPEREIVERVIQQSDPAVQILAKQSSRQCETKFIISKGIPVVGCWRDSNERLLGPPIPRE